MASTRQRWEYLVCSTAPAGSMSLLQKLNQYGDDGWELVAVDTGRLLGGLIFKRPVAAPRKGKADTDGT